MRSLFQEWAGVNGLVRLICSKNGPGSMPSAPVREVPNLRCQTEKENEHCYYLSVGITRDTGYVVQPSKDPWWDELSAQESEPASLCIPSVNSCLRINVDEFDASTLKHPLLQTFLLHASLPVCQLVLLRWFCEPVRIIPQRVVEPTLGRGPRRLPPSLRG